MKVFLVTLFCVFSFLGKTATNLDSLYAIWEDDSQSDTIRVKAFDKYISRGFLYSQPDTAFLLAQQIIDFSVKADYSWGEAVGHHIQGISQSITSNYDRALKCFEQNLAIWQELDNEVGEASTLSNIGIVYYRQGNYPRTLEYFQRSLEMEEKRGNKSAASTTLSNIGVIYFGLENYKEALKCYKRSLAIAEELEDKKGIGTSLVNIGGVYQAQDDYPNALDYYQRSVATYEDLGDTLENADALSNIGAIYERQKHYAKAVRYFKRSTVIFESIGDDYGMATNSLKMGKLYHDQQNYHEAILWYQQTDQKAKEINSVSLQWDASVGIANTYKSLNDWQNALVFSEKAQELNDSLKKDETDEQLQQFEFDRKILQDSIAREKEKREIDLAHQAEINQKNRIQYAAIGGGALVLLLAIGLFSRLRYTNKTKKVIEAEKDRSDNLLLNILPAEVAQELKDKGESEAQHFDQVSILFTDFKSFTQAAEKLNAKELVKEINTYFKAFDHICEKYGIEKIKTIGDAYMAAAGLGHSSEFQVSSFESTKKLVSAALEMQEFVKTRNSKPETANFEMRAGIHTGPVVAGIVGVKKFQYDIWGDTVNTAARMESHGEVGKVNISNASYQILQDTSTPLSVRNEFGFEARQELEVKGKGNMKMWFVKREEK